MIAAGVIVTILGFLLGVFSLGATSNVTVRLVMVLLGIAVSLVGIIGILNRAYLKNAIWRR
jgi:hypothetical protein